MSDIQNGQNITEDQPVRAMPTPDQSAEDAQQPQLPDGVKERTAEEFEKLKASNRELADKLKALEGVKPTHSSVLDELRPNLDTALQAGPSAGFQQPSAPQGGQQLVDEGGYVDEAFLNSTLTKAQKDAQEARSIALQTQQEIQRFQESQVVQAVHKDFPEINPNSDQFDPSFYDFVKNDLVGQMMKGKEDLRSAALKARQVLGQKAPAPQDEQRKETISSRGQASAPTGTSQGTPTQPQDRKDLVARTYKGDKDAIFERLQASGN